MSKLDTIGLNIDLATGKVSPVTRGQVEWEDKKTTEMKGKLGDCDYACCWSDGFGWVPECGCPVHD